MGEEGPKRDKVVSLDSFRKSKELKNEIKKNESAYWNSMKDFLREKLSDPENQRKFPGIDAAYLATVLDDSLLALQDDTASSHPIAISDSIGEAEKLEPAELTAKILELRSSVTPQTAHQALSYVEAVYYHLGGTPLQAN